MYSEEAARYQFTVNLSEPSDKDAYNPKYLKCYCGETCSAGTMFEEKRCRDVEAALDVNAIDGSDWSFDPENEIQGKQWK